ncbi:MAG: hypothetical protein IJ525_00990 [Alphaproteobacteria bacterium]|nr:hypothetical protein [Alphaproteobacteria bacterium]MBR3502244.1 hypothetical protein [Alphaproteobacteria bacterium]
MTDFLENLKKKTYVQGEKLESEALIVAQKVLCNMGLDFLPASYTDFLRVHNGIKLNDGYLFGATVDDDLDIIDKNEQMTKPNGTVLLGYNKLYLLCYNYEHKEYHIVNRQDFSVLARHPEKERDVALAKILKV